jgi:ribonuclease P protein component
MTARLARLKTRGEFLRVAAGRVRAVRPGLILQAAPRLAQIAGESEAALRVGFTASRRVGNAVARNRAKRRLRAAAETLLARQGKPGIDYVLIARAETGARPYAQLLADLEGALRQIARPLLRADTPRETRGEEG